jgi:hypothetical protein
MPMNAYPSKELYINFPEIQILGFFEILAPQILTSEGPNSKIFKEFGFFYGDEGDVGDQAEQNGI